jgi:eukaryotic-like serine/threonine-protein kinase
MSAQQSIAHYRIISKLGEGGMGVVYRATDTKLNRDVAVKLLPEAFASDISRMARFEREAQLLASINHPNIAAIYGIEVGAIVMELVEGPDLAGPVPVDTAIAYARQIAAGLEAAHERGIIHRDLKPANIKVTPDGMVKLLDFGLAKATEQNSAATTGNPTMSPTVSLPMTQAGIILGTAAYMSPEQARGAPVDRRGDIWAFGVILFELLCGRRLYKRETVTDTLAAVILEEPDYSLLPTDTPARVRRLIERCLRKDPKQRLRDIGDARLALEEPEPAPSVAEPRRAWLLWVVTSFALLIAAVAGTAWLHGVSPVTSAVTTRFPLPLPDGMTEVPGILAAPQAVPSPDGRNIAFVARDDAGRSGLWVRPMGSISARRLEETAGAAYPFWSPDSQYIGFFADEHLKKIAVSGGSATTLCEVPATAAIRFPGNGGTWNRDGVIIFAPLTGNPLMRVSAVGGLPTPVTSFTQTDRAHSWPQFLPDGRHFLYFVAGDVGSNGIYVQELGSSNRVLVLSNLVRGGWAPPNYLLFVRGGTLYAQHLNLKTFRVEGDPLSVAQEVTNNENNGRAAFAVSESGVLVYRGGLFASTGQITWLDRRGKKLGVLGQPDTFRSVALSPDGRLAEVIIGPNGKTDAWIMDMASGIVSPLTHEGDVSPSVGPWSPDSQRIAVNLAQGGLREVVVASGRPTALVADAEADDWSPDGRTLLCVAGPAARRLSLLSLGNGSKPLTLMDTPYRQNSFRFSPDGKFVAYVSEESRVSEVFVASFPSFAQKRQISQGGGDYPAWSRDGKELFYRHPPDNLMSVQIRTEANLEAGVPTMLFQYGGSGPGNGFAVAGDGQRFLIMVDHYRTAPSSGVMVVLNWAAELRP